MRCIVPRWCKWYNCLKKFHVILDVYGYHTEAFRVKTNKLPKLLVTKSQLILVFHLSKRGCKISKVNWNCKVENCSMIKFLTLLEMHPPIFIIRESLFLTYLTDRGSVVCNKIAFVINSSLFLFSQPMLLYGNGFYSLILMTRWLGLR